MIKPVREITDNRILTPQQKTFLTAFASSELKSVFRLTGGTALSAFYLEHRLSEDLAFFSSEKVSLISIEEFLKSVRQIKTLSLTRLFDRNIFNIVWQDGSPLKVEFTLYPLINLESTVTIQQVRVDGFLDLVVNKLCAIAERYDAKDYVDVYVAIRNSGHSLAELAGLAEKKCEIGGIRHVFKNRFLQVPEGIDRLPLKVPVTAKEVETFFAHLVRELVQNELGLQAIAPSDTEPGKKR